LLCKNPAVESLPRDADPYNSFNRLRRLHEELERTGGKSSLEDIKKANLAVAVDPAQSPDRPRRSPGRTLWHSVYDCQELSLQVDFYLGEDAAAPARQKRSGYLKFQLQSLSEVRP
jgi:hypothetical protein